MMWRNRKLYVLLSLSVSAMLFSGCTKEVSRDISRATGEIATEVVKDAISYKIDEILLNRAESMLSSSENASDPDKYPTEPVEGTYSELNGNVPYFTATEIQSGSEAFENYSEQDELGRCGVAFANIFPELMPDEERGEIGMVKPTGWKQAKYPELIEGAGYLYNRCHLIAFELAGENANEKNLITGTRAFNLNMLPFENKVAQYVRETGHHVLYRVSPDFRGDELVARGVTIEAMSVEDNGCVFCVYIPNVQPGITIDYNTGRSEKA